MNDEKYSIFIEALRLMYIDKKVDLHKIKKMFNDQKITIKEYEYITK